MVSWIYKAKGLSKQSVPITTNIVSLNPAHSEMYSLQNYVKVCQCLMTGQWFSLGTLIMVIWSKPRLRGIQTHNVSGDRHYLIT